MSKKEIKKHEFDVMGYCKICGDHALENLMNKTCKGHKRTDKRS